MIEFRVLVCGSRTWAGSHDADPYHPTEPQCDMGSPDAGLICWHLDGLYRAKIMTGEIDKLVVIEGAAPGADSVAWTWRERERPSGHVLGAHYPADWYPNGDNQPRDRSAGYKRNALMLKDGRPDLVLGFSHGREASRGTKMMLDLARNAGVRTYRIG